MKPWLPKVAAGIACLCAAGCRPGAQQGYETPLLPDTLFAYTALRDPMPRHYVFDVSGSAVGDDNTPRDQPVTDAGATLGRVLFYDVRLSADRRVSCGSCHRQQFGFGDTARFSQGVNGRRTRRRTMALANIRFYDSGRFGRDEGAGSLPEQVLRPFRDSNELGLPVEAAIGRLGQEPFYGPLFEAAFGSAEITSERIGIALAQFLRAMVSYRARLDSVFRGGGPPNLSLLTALENEGRELFNGRAGCVRCHRTNALNLDHAGNIGLDSVPMDPGAGNGAFKTAALRNVAIRPPYMHDGRFRSLDEVVEFYDRGIQPHPNLDFRLRALDGSPLRLNLTPLQRKALVAYMQTFTDPALLGDERFRDPFRPY